MKHTIDVTELSGHNESPIAGDFVISSNRNFVTRGVTTASTIVNGITGESGTVSAVTSDTITAAGMSFRSGDVFRVSLAAAWSIQNSDMAVIEVECNVCGFSYPRKQLVRGICKTCLDE